jgi:hypothetical protein
MMPDSQVLRSRYHYDFPLTAKNPLTNEVILGEVEFYLIDKNTIQESMEMLCAQGEFSAFESNKVALEAKFFGTDFNYANSKNFRKYFAKNT